MRPLRPQQRPADGAVDETQESAADGAGSPTPAAGASGTRQAPLSPTRMALQARAAEMARLEAVYLRHDLRNIALIAGAMLIVVIGLSFVLH